MRASLGGPDDANRTTRLREDVREGPGVGDPPGDPASWDVSLTAAAPGLLAVVVEFGGPPHAQGQPPPRAGAFLCRADGRISSGEHFVFLGAPASPDGSVRHEWARSSKRGGDRLKVNLVAVSTEVERIAFVGWLPDPGAEPGPRGEPERDTGADTGLAGSFARVVNRSNDAELARVHLSSEPAGATAAVFGEVYRDRGTWRFRAVGRSCPSGLTGVAERYGLDIGDLPPEPEPRPEPGAGPEPEPEPTG